MSNIQRLQFTETVLGLFPAIPDKALKHVTEREARRRQNDRLGVESFVPLALASVTGYIRHNHTEYDELLGTGRYTRFGALERVRPTVQAYLNTYGRA